MKRCQLRAIFQAVSVDSSTYPRRTNKYPYWKQQQRTRESTRLRNAFRRVATHKSQGQPHHVVTLAIFPPISEGGAKSWILGHIAKRRR